MIQKLVFAYYRSFVSAWEILNPRTIVSTCSLRPNYCYARSSGFPPHHLIHYPHITLNNLHDLGADILIDIIRHRNTVTAISTELDSSVNRLEERLCVDAGNDEICLVDGFGTFGGGADADGREGVTNTGEEAAFFWQCT